MSLLRALPRPRMIPVNIDKSLRVLLLCDAENSLTKRVGYELTEREVNVTTIETSSPDVMTAAVSRQDPHIIVCPFMKSRIPESIYSHPQRPCLIVHPGVTGDRGASSIDWAIFEKRKKWGVTVLQAEVELDAGDIWSTSEFDIKTNYTKTSMYVTDISDHAVDCVLDSVSRFSQNIKPISLDKEHSEVWGTFKRNMKKKDRIIDWEMPSEEIVRRVRMSDTNPGAIGNIGTHNNITLRLYDAYEETGKTSPFLRKYMERHRPGETLGHKDGAVLFKAGDSHGVWIGRMKQDIKLPSIDIMKHFTTVQDLPELPYHTGFQEMKIRQSGPVCFVHFDFYNGAMDKFQAGRLEAAIRSINSNEKVKVIVLMGGKRFFSTGIHLCTIQNSDQKASEAWDNINKIDDVILALSEATTKLTVAVLQGNAGAGGAMLAAACDVVLSHPGSVITPTYKAMHLYGSEYWTYFLPRRVGPEMANELVNNTSSISATQAQRIGLIDEIITPDRDVSEEYAENFSNQLLYSGRAEKMIEEKKRSRDDDWFKNLDKHREQELGEMKINFQQEVFLAAMKAFVYHLPAKQLDAEKKEAVSRVEIK